MRKLYTLLSLFMIFGCSSSESINQDLLNKKDGVFYTKDTNEPYSGTVFSLYEKGNKESEWMLKDGRLDGLYTLWYKSGKKWLQNTYKDGELISQKCWDEDGNECECSDLGRGCK